MRFVVGPTNGRRAFAMCLARPPLQEIAPIALPAQYRQGNSGTFLAGRTGRAAAECVERIELKVEIVELSYYLQPLRAWVTSMAGGYAHAPGKENHCRNRNQSAARSRVARVGEVVGRDDEILRRTEPARLQETSLGASCEFPQCPGSRAVYGYAGSSRIEDHAGADGVRRPRILCHVCVSSVSSGATKVTCNHQR
jgi:hypothetical protein